MPNNNQSRVVNYSDKDVVYSVLPHVTISAYRYSEYVDFRSGNKKYLIPKAEFLAACEHFVQNHKTTKPNERN